MSEEVINLEMEFPGSETSLSSSQLPTSALAANEHAPNSKEMELEMAAGDYRNGAPDAQEAGEDMLLDGGKLDALKRREFFDNLLKRVEDDNLHFSVTLICLQIDSSSGTSRMWKKHTVASSFWST